MANFSPESSVALVDTIHGNEQLGVAVARRLRLRPRPGLVLIEGHPEAVASGERYLGDAGEMGGLEGDPTSPNPDQRAKALLNARLDRVNAWLKIIIHNNPNTKAPSFVNFGTITRPERLAVAHLLDIQHVVVAGGYDLHERHTDLIETDQSIEAGLVTEEMLEAWEEVIDKILELGPEGMAELHTRMAAKLRYYHRVGYLELVRGEQLNTVVMEVLEQLEAELHGVERFSPVHLSEELKRHLGLTGLNLVASSSSYDNGSKRAPHLGRSSVTGDPRAEVLGGFFAALDEEPWPLDTGELYFNLPKIDTNLTPGR